MGRQDVFQTEVVNHVRALSNTCGSDLLGFDGGRGLVLLAVGAVATGFAFWRSVLCLTSRVAFCSWLADVLDSPKKLTLRLTDSVGEVIPVVF